LQGPFSLYLILNNPADRFAVGPGGFDRKAIERVVCRRTLGAFAADIKDAN
jgi:hypothetical protein